MEDRYTLSFSLAPGIGPKGFRKLLRSFSSAKNAWSGSQEEFKNAGIGEAAFKKFETFRESFDIDEYLKRLEKAKVNFVPYGDKYYPESLKKIDNPPIGLFTKGNRKLLLSKQRIAVVGARKITSYGREITNNLVSELCSQGLIIVSGMALGVDGIAHQTAVQAQGRTLAVLGCGVDCPYPRENEKLYEEILDSNGLVISEYPLGMPANQGTFPARNRIIAGVSIAVLITEAAEDSGSLITAEHAILQEKPVFAVPGPINSRMSDGTAKLIKQGAILVSSAEDIFDKLEFKIQKSKVKISSQNSKVSGKEMKVLEVLENEERTVDEISKLTKIPVSKLSTILSELELKGLVTNTSGKFRVRL